MLLYVCEETFTFFGGGIYIVSKIRGWKILNHAATIDIKKKNLKYIEVKYWFVYNVKKRSLIEEMYLNYLKQKLSFLLLMSKKKQDFFFYFTPLFSVTVNCLLQQLCAS